MFVIMIEIIPGILDKAFDEIEKKLALAEGKVDWVEIDILDNTLYPNSTYHANWEVFLAWQNRVHLAAHLMVSDPAKYVEPLVTNGFQRLIADVGGVSVRDFIQLCRSHNIEVGVALDGAATLAEVEPFLDEVDTVLVMTINSGLSGQPFLHSTLPKIKKIHEAYPTLPIQVDGGINKETAPLVIGSGATRLISTSYLFWKNPDRIAEAIEELKTTA